MSEYQLMERVAQLEAENEGLRQRALHFALETLIGSDVSSEDAARLLSDFTRLDYNAYALAIVNFGTSPKPSANHDRGEFAVAARILSGAAGERADLMFFKAQETVGCLICVRKPLSSEKEQESFIRGLTDCFRGSLPEFKAAGFERVRISVSAAQDKMPVLRRLFHDVLTIQDHSFGLPDRVVCAYDFAPAVTPDSKRLAVLERQFLNHIAARDFYPAVSVLDEIIDLTLGGQPTLEFMCSSIFVRLNNVLAISGFDTKPDYPEYPELRRAFEAIMKSKSFSQMRDRVHDVFALLSEAVGSPQESGMGKAEGVRRYINENFRDPSLGAAKICETYKLSSSYLSRILKRYMGCGVVDLIHRARIDEVKRLLDETGSSLDEIAELTGFSSRWALIRIFKAQEGVTPGAYRRSEAVSTGE